jgi:hypothetical protein
LDPESRKPKIPSIERRTHPSVIVGLGGVPLDPTIQGFSVVESRVAWFWGQVAARWGPEVSLGFGSDLSPESRKPKMQQTTTPFSLSDKLQYVLCFASFFWAPPQDPLLQTSSQREEALISDFFLFARDMKLIFLEGKSWISGVLKTPLSL